MIFFYSEIDPNLKETECVSVRETMHKKKYDMVIRPCDERISSICRKTDGKTDGSMMTYYRDLTNQREGLR